MTLSSQKIFPLLGVNIDHVATIRQARGESYPSLDRAAQEVLAAGADQITIHLREDRRHIQDHDLPIISARCNQWKRSFNLELSLAPSLRAWAQQWKPDWLCLVPEKREERTTEGGLDLSSIVLRQQISDYCEHWKQHCPETKISLFVEASSSDEILQWYESIAKKNVIDAVEVHTGSYAQDFIKTNNQKVNQQGLDFLKNYGNYESQFKNFSSSMKSFGLRAHAGHGLTHDSLLPLLQWGCFEEYNIGHWIVSESLFTGLSKVVSDLKKLMQRF